MEHYCPLTADRNVDDEHKVREELGVGGGGGEGQPIDTIPKLVTSYCASDRVKSFISAVLNRVFPTEFWRSTHNLTVILDAVGVFLNLRRMEQISLKSITRGIRVLDIKWLFCSTKREAITALRSGRFRKATTKLQPS